MKIFYFFNNLLFYKLPLFRKTKFRYAMIIRVDFRVINPISNDIFAENYISDRVRYRQGEH